VRCDFDINLKLQKTNPEVARIIRTG